MNICYFMTHSSFFLFLKAHNSSELLNVVKYKYLLVIFYVLIQPFKLFQLPNREYHQKNNDQKWWIYSSSDKSSELSTWNYKKKFGGMFQVVVMMPFKMNLPKNGTIEWATTYGRANAKPRVTIAGMASSQRTKVKFIRRIPSWYNYWKDGKIRIELLLLYGTNTFSNECFNHQSGDIIVSPQTILVYKTPRLQSFTVHKIKMGRII